MLRIRLVFLLIVCFFFLTASKWFDLTETYDNLKLRGPVRLLVDSTNNITYTFNRLKQIEKVVLESNQTRLYTYSQDAKLQTCEFMESGTLTRKLSYEYDAVGLMIRSIETSFTKQKKQESCISQFKYSKDRLHIKKYNSCQYNKYYYEYLLDTTGNILREHCVKNSLIKKKIYSWIYSYDKNNNQTQLEEYRNEIPQVRTTWAFDSNNNKIVSYSFDENNEVVSKDTSTYDASGNLITNKYYEADSENEDSYLYNYTRIDPMGNWTQREVFQDGVFVRIETRYFEYY